MPQVSAITPELLPVLAAGRHRNAKRGACFMEYASVLAGEKWSDHPSCTHPAVASLARAVNDCTTDAARSGLAVLVPSVIGLTGDDPRIPVIVSVRAGIAALPIASEVRQRTIAVGLIHISTILCGGRFGDLDDLVDEITVALDAAPGAVSWAEAFSAGIVPSPGSTSRALSALMAISIVGITEACVNDNDARLRAVLAQVISDCRGILGAPTAERETLIVRERENATA